MLNQSFGNVVSSASKPASSDRKLHEDKAPQSSISFVYQAEIADSSRNVTITWSKSLSNHLLAITLENLSDDQNHHTIKIDFKGLQFWGKKGLKSLEVNNKRVDVYWDFRQAKFSNSPEPCSGYYIALVSDEAVALIIGDLKEEALKRTRKRPSSSGTTLVCKKEHVCGKRAFYMKALLDESKREHDIVIEISLSGPDDPEMWITIDGIAAIRIMNLNWRFRGNEVVRVNDIPVEIFWDVHDWLFDTSGLSSGLFIFKPGGSLELASEGRKSSCNGADAGAQSVSEYCHVLYAWKMEP